MGINNKQIFVICKNIELAISSVITQIDRVADSEKVIVRRSNDSVIVEINDYKILFKKHIQDRDRGYKGYVAYIDKSIEYSNTELNMIYAWTHISSNKRPVRLCDFENDIGIDIIDLILRDGEE